MVIETFLPGQVRELYKRFDEKGRKLPPGVEYINSWIDENVQVCYQVMESSSKEKVEEWSRQWEDLATFVIIPVLTSKQVREKMSQW